MGLEVRGQQVNETWLSGKSELLLEGSSSSRTEGKEIAEMLTVVFSTNTLEADLFE